MSSQILKSGRKSRGGQRYEICYTTRTQATVVSFEDEEKKTQTNELNDFYELEKDRKWIINPQEPSEENTALLTHLF